MVRARSLLEGITAPMCSGFSIHERRKRTSSSRRRGFFNARTDDCKGMSLPGGTANERGMSENSHKHVKVEGDMVKPNGNASATSKCPRSGDKILRKLNES